VNLLCAHAAATVSVTHDASFVPGFGGKLPAGHSTLLAQIVGQRQCDDCRDSTHADQNRVEVVSATGGMGNVYADAVSGDELPVW
jgi:hypothetical protein